jgi:hypothetical protein
MSLTPDEPRQATLLSLPEAIPAPDPLVARLAAALCVDRPWQRIVDPVRAAAYFRGRARSARPRRARGRARCPAGSLRGRTQPPEGRGHRDGLPMSRGPGRIERAIRALFDAQPDEAWPTEVLAARCYDEPTERGHMVSVLRAAHKIVAADPHWATWRMWDSRQCVFVNEASEASRARAKCFRARSVVLAEGFHGSNTYRALHSRRRLAATAMDAVGHDLARRDPMAG